MSKKDNTKILAQPEYAFYVHDDDPSKDGDLNPKIIRETWVENVYRIKEGDFWDSGVFVDLGANIGAVSLWVDRWNADRDKKIKIFMVEPEPTNVQLLINNWTANPTNSEPTLIQKAVWYENKTVKISPQGANANILDEVGTEVETITLEQILDTVEAETGNRGVDVLKCDIEGAEYELFLNTPDEVLQSFHYIVLETDATNTDNWGRAVQKLSENFHVETLGAASRGAYIYAKRY